MKKLFGCDTYTSSKAPLSFWDDIPKKFDSNSLGPIILQNSFRKITRLLKIEVTRYYVLFQNHLVYKNKMSKKLKKIAKLDTIVYDTKITNDKNFTFILKTDNLITIELMTSDKNQFEIWETQLSKICLKINFKNHYNVLNLLGSGNYSKVFLVEKISDGKKFAGKFFDKKMLNSDLKVHKLILNEINLTRTLSHPSLVQVYETFKIEGSYCMIMEYMPGGELADRIDKLGGISEAKCQIIMKKVLEGLNYLHCKRILHRDLKLENLLLYDKKDYSTLKIADFGFSTHIEDIAKIYSRCGTPGFVAPEVLSVPFNKDIDQKTDVFAAGCIMYKLLTGSLLFNTVRVNNILKLNKECKINFDSFYFKQMSSSALGLLKEMLKKDPRYRIATSETLNHEFFHSERCDMSISENVVSPINSKLASKFNMEQLKKRNLSTNSILNMRPPSLNVKPPSLNLKPPSLSYSSKNMDSGSMNLLEIPESCFNHTKSPTINKSCHYQMEDDVIEPLSKLLFDKFDNSGFSFGKNTICSTMSPVSMNGRMTVLHDTVFNDYMRTKANKAKTYLNCYDSKGDDPVKTVKKRQVTHTPGTLDVTPNNNSNKLLNKEVDYDLHRLSFQQEKLNVVLEGNNKEG